MTQLAIIGSTASGKSALAIKVAKHINAHILSLDSLSIYKEIDIVSAKPSVMEQEGVRHFGIDYLYPHEAFDVTTFITLYQKVYAQCLQEQKNLIIVGGTGFYLKSLMDGISTIPSISEAVQIQAKSHLKQLEETYHWLYRLDATYMSHIASTDRYRIEKALLIYLQTGCIPSTYFAQYPPTPIITSALDIYQITWDRALLRERIVLRTDTMIQEGLIDEICFLEKKYSRLPHCMKAIGIKETLAYLDGIYNKAMMRDKIITNTSRLAKRQNTFNQSQFKQVKQGSIEALEKLLLH